MKQQSGDKPQSKLAMDTLEELDWCLDQLETIQSHRSVGDMATTKFKRMLNKELSHFSESKSGSQISEYIFRTFLGKSCALVYHLFYIKRLLLWHISIRHFAFQSLFADEQEELDLPFLRPEDPAQSVQMAHVVTTSNLPTDSQQHEYRPGQRKTLPGQTMSHISGVKKSLAHTNSLTHLPKYGIETSQEDILGKVLEGIDMWGLDVFQVSEYSNGHPLTVVMYTIFKVSRIP